MKIRQRPDITIRPYSPNQEIELERPNAETVDFTIDYADYFAVTLDDVYEIQSDMNLMSIWTEDASESMKITVDRGMLANVVLGGADAANSGTAAGRITQGFNMGVTGSPLTVDKDTITDLIVDMGTILDEQNVPETNRWIVMPAWMCGLVKKSELKDASLAGDGTSILRNGRMGMIDRFTLYHSNLLPAGTEGGLAAGEYAVFAGHNSAITFASQVNKVEMGPSERTFGKVLKGLQVYGCEVIKPESLVEVIVSRT